MIAVDSHAYRDYYGLATARDGNGNVMSSAKVTVYLAGTTTPATVYDSSVSTTPLTYVTSASNGTFSFYVDRLTYSPAQKFKLVITKTGYTTLTNDNVAVAQTVLGTYTLSGTNTVSHHLTIPEGVIYSGDATLNFTVQPTIGLYQVFDPSLTVTGLRYAYGEWFGAKADSGTTDNTLMINAATAAAPIIHFSTPSSKGYYKITDEIAVDTSNKTFLGPDGDHAKIVQATASKKGFNVSASNVSIKRLEIQGTQYAAVDSSESAIYAAPPINGSYPTIDNAYYDTNRITDVVVEDCIIHDWGYEGIKFYWVDRPKALQNRVYNISYSAIQGRNTNYGDFSNNLIEDVTGGGGTLANGITIAGTVSQATAPKYNNVSNNKIFRCAYEGIDLEPGEYTTVSNNQLYDCYLPIIVGAHSVAGGGYSKYNTIENNLMVNITLSTAASRFTGINEHGIDSTHLNTGNSYIGNTVVGYGTHSPASYGAIYMIYSSGSTWSGNKIVGAHRVGMYIADYVQSAIITGTTIDTLATDVAGLAGIYIAGEYNSHTYITNNTINTGAIQPIYGVGAHNELLRIGINKLYVTAVQELSTLYPLNETIHKDATVVDVSGTTNETTLRTITIGANSMNMNSMIRVTAFGYMTGASGNKTIKLYWGSAAYMVVPASTSNDDWRVTAEIMNNNNSLSLQSISWIGYHGGTVTQGFETGAQATTSDVVLKLTGTLADSSEHIIQRGFIVERY